MPSDGSGRRDIRAAAAQLRATAVHLFKEKEVKYPEYKSMIEQMLGAFTVYVTPLRETMAWGIRDVLWMLLAAVALLFSLVLFNLGNLLLTRNAQRLREYTVRQALGASRWQLFRQSFLEQAVLIGLAAGLAIVLMAWGIEIVRAIGANKLPRLYELHFSFTYFGLLALFLSALGLFGVASLSAARRRREFGIRLAVGATGSQIVRLELARTAMMVVVGLASGLLLSTAVARAMAGLLFRVGPWNGEIFGVAAVVLIGSASLAGWLPARRATRTDPASALRME
jgi:ABC-type antimicrobial peptide transport system permease subunit